MVKVGFVVEGESEVILLKSLKMRTELASINIGVCYPIINTNGCSNMVRGKIEPYINACRYQAKPQKIVVLKDMEGDICYTMVKDNIGRDVADAIVIVRRALEAWYMADTEAINRWYKGNFPNETPETLPTMPFDFIKSKRLEKHGIGVGGHIKLAKDLVKCGFSILRAAKHKSCPSAEYFLKKMKKFGEES